MINKETVKIEVQKVLEIVKFWDKQFYNNKVNYQDHRKIVTSCNFIIKRLEKENEWNGKK